MLRHEDNQETPAPTAAQARVTPQELTEALARLEARQEDGEGTIPLGEAVQELGLKATPEELLCEIEAGRTRSQEGQARTHQRRSDRLKVGSVFALAFLMFGAMFAFLRTPVHPRPVPPVVAATVPEPQAPPLSITIDPHLMVGDTSGKIVEFSDVGDDQPVLCGYVYGTFEPYSFNGSGPFWTVIKHHGQVYVRGWMSQTAQQVRQKNGADVEQDSSPVFSIPVTLPLDGFQVVPIENDHEEFHAMNVHLDKHAYKKWEQ